MILGKNPRSLPFYYQQQFEFFLHPRSLQPQAQGSVPGEQKMQSFAPGVLTSNVNIHLKHAHLLQRVTSHIDMGILVIRSFVLCHLGHESEQLILGLNLDCHLLNNMVVAIHCSLVMFTTQKMVVENEKLTMCKLN